MTNVNDFQIFNYHWCPQEYIEDKIEYMTGSKTGCEKDKKQLIDVIFRQKYNLNNYYKTCQDDQPTGEEKTPKDKECEEVSKNKETPTLSTIHEYQELSN